MNDFVITIEPSFIGEHDRAIVIRWRGRLFAQIVSKPYDGEPGWEATTVELRAASNPYGGYATIDNVKGRSLIRWLINWDFECQRQTPTPLHKLPPIPWRKLR